MFKRILLFSFLLLSCTLLVQAQSEENRNKLEMTVSYGGKSVVVDLISVGTSISRYTDYYDALAKDSAGKHSGPTDKKNSFFLSLVVRKMKPELLSLFAKRTTRFAGTITVTDTYGKTPPTNIKFTEASLETYSDQFSGSSYSDSYSGANVTITCKTMNINGIEIEL